MVIRDSYHRYTVDEHTFLVIDNIHGLRPPANEHEQRLAQLLPEIDRIDFFSPCSCTTPEKDAATASTRARAWNWPTPSSRGSTSTPRSASPFSSSFACTWTCRRAMRRDIFDMENVRRFAEKMGDPQMLKMLTVMTFADIKAVNPDALTPWKAENLWQFYMSTANFMDRSVDESRYRAAIDPTLLNRIRSMVPAARHDDLRERSSRGFLSATCRPACPSKSANHFPDGPGP